MYAGSSGLSVARAALRKSDSSFALVAAGIPAVARTLLTELNADLVIWEC